MFCCTKRRGHLNSLLISRCPRLLVLHAILAFHPNWSKFLHVLDDMQIEILPRARPIVTQLLSVAWTTLRIALDCLSATSEQLGCTPPANQEWAACVALVAVQVSLSFLVHVPMTCNDRLWIRKSYASILIN